MSQTDLKKVKVYVAFKDLKKVKIDETLQLCRDIEQGRLSERRDLQTTTEQINKQQKINKQTTKKNFTAVQRHGERKVGRQKEFSREQGEDIS